MENSKQWGLNGVGRIGREVLAQNSRLNIEGQRTTEKPGGIEISVINEPVKPLAKIVGDIRYDLIHGCFPGRVSPDIVQEGGNDYILINRKKVKVTRESEPAIAWQGEGLFGVIDASGQYRERAKAATHLDGTGVSHVLITAPSPDSDLSLVHGINNESFRGQRIVDNASCTTKSALPVVQTLDREFGIEDADLETVHAATGSELKVLMDRMALNEAAPETIVRAVREGILRLRDVDWILDESTGAAKNVTRILPELEGKFRARAKRVASPNGSLSIMNFLLRRETNPDRIRKALLEAVNRYPIGVLRAVPNMPSTEALNGMNDDSVVPLDRIEGRRIFKVVAAYSNEVGPSRSAVETARLIQEWSPPTVERTAAYADRKVA